MATFTVKDHFLYRDGKRVAYWPSPNRSGLLVPEIIVIHYTGDNNLNGALSWLCNPLSKVSAHLVIAKDGKVYQLVPFNVVAWHAGVSAYEGRSGVNKFSIGIENVGFGDVWPAAQVEANRAVIRALTAHYGIEFLVGHEDVAPGRKSDPGPRYPWDEVTAAPEAPVVVEEVPAPVPVPEPVEANPQNLWGKIVEQLARVLKSK